MTSSPAPLSLDPDSPLGLTPGEAAIEAASKPSIGFDGLADQLFRNNSGYGSAPGQTVALTYAFLGAANLPDDAADQLTTSFLAFDAVQRAAFNEAIAIWEDFANVDFQLVTSAAPGGLLAGNETGINLWVGGFTTGKSYAWSNLPAGDVAPADFVGHLRFNLSSSNFSDVSLAGFGYGNYGFTTFLHELGHSLGLQHPGDYNADDTEAPTFLDDAQFQEDNRATTLMSYFSEYYGGADFMGFNPSTPLIGDILAMQKLYGTPPGGLKDTTPTTYGFGGDYAPLAITTAADQMVGAIYDTSPVKLDLSPYFLAADIDLEQVFQSTGGLVRNLQIISTTVYVVIGGHGADTIRGDAGYQLLDGGEGDDSLAGRGGDDRLLGREGNDTLHGGTGFDTLTGGAGDDSYIVDSEGDTVEEQAGQGEDLIITTRVAFNLGDAPHVEHLTHVGAEDFLGIGTDAANRITGAEGEDTLLGGEANDTLDGGAGADSLTGGAGDDIYVVDDPNDVVVETFNDGNDAVRTSLAAHVLSIALENLSYTGSGDFTGTGNAENNVILSLGGADTLDGAGGDDLLLAGAGDDVLKGGAGRDTLDGGADADTLDGDSGHDLLRGGDGADLLQGGSDQDTLQGDAGHDTLRGGEGADLLQGGDDDDLFLVDSGADTIEGGAGRDTLSFEDFPDAPGEFGIFLDVSDPSAGIGYSAGLDWRSWHAADGSPLASPVHEIEVFIGTHGDDRMRTGGVIVELRGGEGDDTLTGFGTGTVLDGGDGEDTLDLSGLGLNLRLAYALIHAQASLLDADGNETGIPFSATGFENVIGLSDAGAANILTGTYLANRLTGGAGADVLAGTGGNDTLIGLGGMDTLRGGDGDDLVRIGGNGAPAGEAEGGDDWDTLALVGLEGTSFTFTPAGTPAGSHGALTWMEFEQVDAAMRADLLTGARMTGGENNDTLTGAGGQDTLVGAQGADLLSGMGGDDRFEISFLDGTDTIDGGDGIDTVFFTAGGPAGLNVNLSGPGFGPQGLGGPPTPGGGVPPPGGDAPGGGVPLPAATLISIEKTLITLGDGADYMVGSFADDTIIGAGGDDTLDGASGADLLEGGADNDLLSDSFAGGPDTMRGGEGHDTLFSGSGADLTEGGAGNDLLRNRAFFYPGITAIAAEYDTMQGGDGDDTIQSLTPGSFDGGAGTDLLEFSLANAPAGVTLKLGNPAAKTTLPFGTKITGFERYDLALTSFDDQVSVAYGQHALDGGYGADILIILLSGGQDVPDSVSLLDPFALPGEGTTVTFANGMVVRGFDLILYTKPNTPAGPGDDLLFGTETANHLLGLGGNDTLRGFGGSDTLSGGSGADRLYGGKGDDVYYVETEGDQTFEQAAEGVDRVYSTMSWTLAENFETLILLGQADLDGTGNGQTNRLDGTEGANLLDGAGGNDGLFGKGGADHLVGGDGDDSLDGGLGADVLEGGAGDDVYIVDEAGDTTLEQAGSGLDRVKASLDWTLAAELERLSLLGAADLNGTGNGLDNRLDGNAGANALAGGEGNDSFYGLDGADTLLGGSGNDAMDGGVGADSMEGGVGDDWYFVNDPGDLTVELAGQGQDRVSTMLDWVLGAEIERLSLQGAADLNGTGNALDNRLDGNAGANLLAGGEGHDTFYGLAGADTLLGGIGNDALDGGAGADSLVGGLGDDWYFVNDPGDLTMELAGQGYDRLSTSINWTLGAEIERLGLQGAADLDGTGNALDNRLDGNAGANRLEGGDGRDTLYGLVGDDTLIGGVGLDSLDGGAGDDRMEGGAENDVYIVDSVGDVVIELANGGGADSVRTSLLQYVIPDEVEYLTLIGSGAFEISGNAKYNLISGSGGNDTIDGMGGNDTLSGKGGVDRLGGQGGNDVFTFHRGEAAGDIVTDFDGKGAAMGDRLIFNGYGPGASFTDLGGGDWELTSGDGLTVEVIHFLGTPAIHLSDYVFK